MRIRSFAILHAVVLCVLLASAAGDRLSCRPLFTSDAGIADRGQWVAEIGIYEFMRGGREQKFLGPSVKVNCGFSCGWEASAAWTVRAHEDRNVSLGIEDIYGGVKHMLREGRVQGKKGPSVSLSVNGLLPSNATGEDTAGFEVLSALSAGAGKASLHANLGVAYGREDPGPGLICAGAAEYPVTGGISLAGEVVGAAVRAQLPQARVLAGLVSRTDIGTFDIGVWKNSFDAPGDISFTVGTTIPLE